LPPYDKKFVAGELRVFHDYISLGRCGIEKGNKSIDFKKKEKDFVSPYHSSSSSSLPKNHGTMKNQKINHLSISLSC